jgi:hypothetical protein
MGGCRFGVVCLCASLWLRSCGEVTSFVSEACADVGGRAGTARACREAGKRKVIPPPVACMRRIQHTSRDTAIRLERQRMSMREQMRLL